MSNFIGGFFIAIALVFIGCFLVESCAQPPIHRSKTNNPNLDCSLLFEHDGINVYRFYDDGRFHWFTSKGECMSPYRKQIGKYHTYKDEVIQ